MSDHNNDKGIGNGIANPEHAVNNQKDEQNDDNAQVRSPEGVDETKDNQHHELTIKLRYDYCVVMRTSDNKSLSKLTSKLLLEWEAAGLEHYIYIPGDRSVVYILLRPKSLDVLRNFAEKLNFQMMLCAESLEEDLKSKNVEINDDPSFSKYAPCEYIFAPYRRYIEHLFAKVPEYNEDMGSSESHPFSHAYRVKLIEMILLGGPMSTQITYELNIKKLHRMGHIYAYFPMPEQWMKKELQLTCADMICNKPFPTRQISDYFGSKMNIYFQFAGHVNTYMLFPAVVSLAFQLAVAIKEDFSFPVGPFFAVLISAWATVVLKFWKRRENELSLMSDTEEYEELEVNRPEYKGARIKSFIDGSDYRYFSPRMYFVRRLVGTVVIAICSLFSIACVAGIYYLQFKLQNTSLQSSSQSICSVINVLSIIILSQLFTLIAKHINSWENHRTDSMHEDSLATKTFTFQFINAFSSFFFIAFIAQWLKAPDNAAPEVRGQCAYSSCITTLAINLTIIIGTRLFVTNAIRAFTAAVSWCCCERRRIEMDTVSEAEIEFRKQPFEPTSYFLVQYSELAIVFGHVVLFSAALPIVVFFACLIYYLEVRFDLFDLLHKIRRPNISVAEDIGAWQSIFGIVALISVMTNAGMIVYTMDNLRDYSETKKAFLFIGIQWVLFGFRYLVERLIPDVPQDVTTQYQRASFINDVVLAGKDLTPYTYSRKSLSSLATTSSPSRVVPLGSISNPESSATSGHLPQQQAPTTPVRASSRVAPTPATSIAASFRIHEVGPSYIPADKLPLTKLNSSSISPAQ